MTSRALRDPEIIELFADEPESLALIDAVGASGYREQRVPRSGRRGLLSLAAAFAVAVVAAGVFVRQQPQAGVVQRALKAVSGPGVIRLQMIDSRPSDVIVDLERGTSVRTPHVVVVWFDPQTGRSRVRDLIGGIAVSDRQLRGSGAAARSITAANFALSYRTALATRTAAVSRARVRGVAAYWLRFSGAHALSAVAINRQTYQPLLVEMRAGGERTTLRVRSITRLDPGAPALRAVGRVPHPSTVGVVDRVLVSRPQPVISAGQPRAFPVARVETVRFANGIDGEEAIFSDEKVQGRLPTHFLRIQLANFASSTFGWTPALVALATPGRLVIERAGAYTLGYLHLGRHFIRLSTSEGSDDVITAAQRLRATR